MVTEKELMREAREKPCVRSVWDAGRAKEVARRAGIAELTEPHWRVIACLRNHFVVYGAPPPQPTACLLGGLRVDCEDELFGGPEQARAVAGLPDLAEEE